MPTPEGTAERDAILQGAPSTAAQKSSAPWQTTRTLGGPRHAVPAPEQAATEPGQHPMPSQHTLLAEQRGAAAGQHEPGHSQAVGGTAAPTVPTLARHLPAFPVRPAAMTRTRRRTMAVSSRSASVAKHAAKEPSDAHIGAIL